MTKARSKSRTNRSFPRSSPSQIKDPEHKARSYLHESDEQRTGKSTNVKLARRCQFRCCFSIRFFHCSTSCSNTRFKALGNNIRKQIDFFMYIFYGRIIFYLFFPDSRALLKSQSQPPKSSEFFCSIVTIRSS